jgi:predicted nucleic acid-binding protein
MVKVLFDTNVLIDYLNGIVEAKDELTQHTDSAISVITWMEVLVGATPTTETTLKAFLSQFHLLPIDHAVSETSVRLRQQHKIKLPDAIIWATSITDNRILVTRNTKDFKENQVGIFVPYQLEPK